MLRGSRKEPSNKGLQLTGMSLPLIRQLGCLFRCFPAAEPQRSTSFNFRAYKILTVVVLAVILVPSLLIGGCYVRAKQYGRGYSQVAMGQPKQRVIEAMGKPSEIEACDGPVYADGKVAGQCSETMVYYAFLEKWGVFLDKNGNVIGKYYNVSG